MRSATAVTASPRFVAQRAPSHWPPLGELRAGLMAATEAAAAAAGSGEWEAPARALRALAWLGQEFVSDWEAQDLRAALFQLLLLWLLVSLLGIQVAWRVYGNTVTGLYYRQGPGGQNGGTPDGSSHFSMWESSGNETMKTHRE